MPGTLHVVATPIGNLEDITLRALRVLREADLIAAEDTRRTAKLLNHYGIATRTISLYAQNEAARVPGLLARLDAGQELAFVTDAGTPTVSDPGARLIAAAIERGHRVTPVPGPSAILAALVASGFPADAFVFAGFPPRRAKDRKQWFHTLASETRPVVFFEAPHRIRQTLAEAGTALGTRQLVVSRELTKTHEELLRGPAIDMAGRLTEIRGEFTIVVSGRAAIPREAATAGAAEIEAKFRRMTKSGPCDPMAVVKQLAKQSGLTKREVYRIVRRRDASGN
jgi:16S rRNA (cytidine1402-2'-O)-methyltransferase